MGWGVRCIDLLALLQQVRQTAADRTQHELLPALDIPASVTVQIDTGIRG
jgi:hypothetical protein